jgi:hypothetical protein
MRRKPLLHTLARFAHAFEKKKQYCGPPVELFETLLDIAGKVNVPLVIVSAFCACAERVAL